MKAYKAIQANYKGTATDPAFEVGKTYTRECTGRHMSNGSGGFYAAEDPLFCLSFHTPESGGRYHEVELSGMLDTSGIHDKQYTSWNYTEVAASTMTVGRELSVEEMVWRSFEYRREWCTAESSRDTGEERTCAMSGTRKSILATGDKSVAISSREDGKARVTGLRSAAAAEGTGGTAVADGPHSIALALGPLCRARGCRGSWLLLTDRTDYMDGKKYRRTAAVHVDGFRYKEGTDYILSRGEVMPYRTFERKNRQQP